MSEKSEVFYGAVSMELHPCSAPTRRCLASTTLGGWRLKGKLRGSAIRSYRMRALSNCPQLETVPLLRHVFRQEAEPVPATSGKGCVALGSAEGPASVPGGQELPNELVLGKELGEEMLKAEKGG